MPKRAKEVSEEEKLETVSSRKSKRVEAAPAIPVSNTASDSEDEAPEVVGKDDAKAAALEKLKSERIAKKRFVQICISPLSDLF